MIRHPYASALVAPAVTTTNAVIRANTYAPVDGAQYQGYVRKHGIPRSRSHLGLSKSSSPSSPSQNLVFTPIPIVTRRPEGEFVLHDSSAGVSLTLFGQEPHTVRADGGINLTSMSRGGHRGVRQMPTYGRGAVVDGRVDISNPENVTKIEAKVSGVR
jgi:hypothetical protein